MPERFGSFEHARAVMAPLLGCPPMSRTVARLPSSPRARSCSTRRMSVTRALRERTADPEIAAAGRVDQPATAGSDRDHGSDRDRIEEVIETDLVDDEPHVTASSNINPFKSRRSRLIGSSNELDRIGVLRRWWRGLHACWCDCGGVGVLGMLDFSVHDQEPVLDPLF